MDVEQKSNSDEVAVLRQSREVEHAVEHVDDVEHDVEH